MLLGLTPSLVDAGEPEARLAPSDQVAAGRSGRLEIPGLTLHDALDPVAPVFHESLYREQVTAAEAGDRLVQHLLARYGHCVFETDAMTQALEDLAAWAEHGVVPAP